MITKKFIFSIIIMVSLISFSVVSAEETSSVLDTASDDSSTGNSSTLDSQANDDTTGEDGNKETLDENADDDTTGTNSNQDLLDDNADDDTTGTNSNQDLLDENADDDTTGTGSNSLNDLLDENADDDTTGGNSNGSILDDNADDDTTGTGSGSNNDNNDNDDNDDEDESTGGRRVISSGGSSNRNSGGSVLGATTDGESCGLYLTDYLKYGTNNNPAQVLKLQVFLNEFIDADLQLNGVFDEATFIAVKELQALHDAEILQPWVDAGTVSFLEPTGYVYKTTRHFINTQKCKELNLVFPNLREGYVFQSNLQMSTGLPATGGAVLGADTFSGGTCGVYLHDFLRKDFANDPVEVKKLQEFLNDFNVANIEVNGIFNEETENAVRSLQARYADEILQPWVDAGIAVTLDTTGYVFKTTQYFINTHKCPELNLEFPEL